MPYSRRAGIYDVEYVEQRDYAFVEELLGDGTLRALEVPCGAGRLSTRLAQKTAALTLVDLEPAMVEKAALACAGRQAEIRAEVADMRELDIKSVFDVALIPREALQLLSPDDGRKAVSAIGAHVDAGGLLFVDLATFQANKEIPTDPDYFDPDRSDDVWKTNWTRNLADGSSLTRSSAQRQEAGSIHIRLAYHIAHPMGAQDRWRSEMRLFRYERNWLDDATPDGMNLDAVYGGYDYSPFSDKSPRMIAIYRRPISLKS